MTRLYRSQPVCEPIDKGCWRLWNPYVDGIQCRIASALQPAVCSPAQQYVECFSSTNKRLSVASRLLKRSFPCTACLDRKPAGGEINGTARIPPSSLSINAAVVPLTAGCRAILVLHRDRRPHPAHTYATAGCRCGVRTGGDAVVRLVPPRPVTALQCVRPALSPQ